MRTLILALIVPFLASGCGLFDSGVVWKDGMYFLGWIDIPEDVSLSYDLGDGASAGRVEPRVFAVGSNARYIVVKQHPKGDKRITNYFFLDKDSRINDGVTGPLSEKEFERKAKELNLPAFSKTLKSLE